MIDGGVIWFIGLNLNFYVVSFQFIDVDNGFVVNGSFLSQSKDGGFSWIDVSMMLFLGMYWVVFQNVIYGIVFGLNGIFEISDGGLMWMLCYIGSMILIYVVSYVDVKIVWVFGLMGDVLMFIDGGMNWQCVIVLVIGFMLLGVSFFDVKCGWIVGSGGIVLVMVDGGKIW